MPYKDPEKQKAASARGSKKYYEKNKAKVIANTRATKAENKKKWHEFKKTLSCVMCGFKHPAAIDFHHVNPEEKEHSIFQLIRAGRFGKAYAEIEKCVTLCANCHRIHHYNERKTKQAILKKAKKRGPKPP